MAIKKLIEVWDGKNLLKENIKFLKKNTKEVHLPLSANNKEHILTRSSTSMIFLSNFVLSIGFFEYALSTYGVNK